MHNWIQETVEATYEHPSFTNTWKCTRCGCKVFMHTQPDSERVMYRRQYVSCDEAITMNIMEL